MLFLRCFSPPGTAGWAGQLTDGARHDSGREIGYVYKSNRSSIHGATRYVRESAAQQPERPAAGREDRPGKVETLFLSIYPRGLAWLLGPRCGPFCSRPLHHFHFFLSRSVSPLAAYCASTPTNRSCHTFWVPRRCT